MPSPCNATVEVISQTWIEADKLYKTLVRFDNGDLKTIYFPDAHEKGELVPVVS